MKSQEQIQDLAKQTLFYKENKHSAIIQKAIENGFVDGYNQSVLSTPFVDMDEKEICVGDFINDPKDEKSFREVRFGEYKAGTDDWNMDYILYGYHIRFSDGGFYSLTQEGKGYSISARECKIVGNIHTNPELIYKPKND